VIRDFFLGMLAVILAAIVLGIFNLI